MVRTLFDTSMYSRFIEYEDGVELAEKIVTDNNFVVHNFSLIRRELRDTPKDKITETNKKLRIALLTLYDRLVRGRVIEETKQIKRLSEEYFSEYKGLGGAMSYKELSNDFKIVACASLNDMDIVYSEDKRSLCSGVSIKAYNIVNLRKDKRTPSFIDFETLRKSKT